jgi:hypothetical protein
VHWITQLNLAAWMYVSRDKSQAVVFAFSLNSDHWSNLVPRLQLQGLLPEAEYEVTEPLPNNITQASGNLMIIETEGKMPALECLLLPDFRQQFLPLCASLYSAGVPAGCSQGLPDRQHADARWTSW